MAGGSIAIDRSAAIQLGAVALITAASACSGGGLVPLAAALVGTGFASNVLAGLFARAADKKEEDRRRRSMREQNHHVQRAINLAIARCIDDAGAQLGGDNRKFLKKVAADIKKDPLALEMSEAPSGGADEKRITELLSGSVEEVRARRVLSAEEWARIIDAASQARQWSQWEKQAQRREAVDRTAEYLAANFSAALVQTMKELGAESDPAWFALVMRFLGEIHAGVQGNGAAIVELKSFVGDHAEEMRGAIARVEAAVARRGCAGGGGLSQEDKDHLEFIRGAAEALERDLPELREAAELTKKLLPQVAEEAAGAHKHAKDAASVARENKELLEAYGFVPLIASNVPPLPHTFVERKGPLEKLAAALWNGDTASLVGRAQASGYGGFGKTILAHHYAHANRGRYPGGVFVVKCEGRTLAEALDQLMPPHEGVKGMKVEERAAIVRAKLSGDKASLLILDNIDSGMQWQEYRGSGLLPTPPCHVLITTRVEEIRDVPVVEVEKLEEAEAVELLAKYRASALEPCNRDAVAAILRETERLAALVAAVGMAMAEDESDDWVAYAKWLAGAKPDSLPDAGEWVASHRDYPHKTAAILDDLRRRLHPAALRALDYAALLPVDTIADGWIEALLEADADASRGDGALELGTDTRGRKRDPAWFTERLRERDLLRPASEDGKLWSLHRLHRKRAHDHFDAEPGRKRAMLEAIAGHAARRGSWLGQPGEDGAERWVRHEHRWELEALHGLVRLPRTLSFDHADVVLVLNEAAYLLGALGRAAEAEPLYEEALEMYRRLFKGDHPDVAQILNNLAGVRKSLGRAAEAEPLFEEALEMRRRLFKGDHPHVAANLNNLASVRESLGRAAEAEPLCEEALEMNRRLFKGDHPAVALSLNNLAGVRKSLGRAAEAEPLYEESLEMYRRLFKGDHPDVAQSLNNLAGVRQSLGRAAEADPLFEEALEMRRRLFKGDHPDVAQSLNNLAFVRQSLGRAAEAEPLYEEALKMYRRLFKGDHPAVALSLNNLAVLRFKSGRREEALPLIEEAAEMILRLFGLEHPTARTILKMRDMIRREAGVTE